MSAGRIAERYAKALIELAQDRNILEDVYSDAGVISKSLEVRDLHLLAHSPIVSTAKKKSVFSKVFGGKINELTSSFMDIIIRKRREAHLGDIMASFMKQYEDLKKQTKVVLTTAAPVSDAEIAAIKERLGKSHSINDNIDIQTKVNPDLLGGFIVEFDDKLYDASVARKLSELKKKFSNS